MKENITIMIVAVLLIGYFHQCNLVYRSFAKLKKVKNDLKIPYADYSRYQKNSVIFYRYLADMRKDEKSSVQLINKIINRYDSLLFDVNEESKCDSSGYCECTSHTNDELEYGYCTQCKRVIND